LEVAPRTGSYIAVGYGRTHSSSEKTAASRYVKIWGQGQRGWLSVVDEKLSGRSVHRISFSEIDLADHDPGAIATRVALLTEDQGILAPTLFMLARYAPTTNAAASAPSAVPEFRFEEFQNLLTPLRENDLVDLEFSGDGQSLLAVGQRDSQVLLSDIPQTISTPKQ
jgi:hypothetical protein